MTTSPTTADAWKLVPGDLRYDEVGLHDAAPAKVWVKTRVQDRLRAGQLALFLGAFALALPTMRFVALESWANEAGAHGPIVLITGIWLFVRLWPKARARACPPHATRVALALTALLPLYVVTRVTQIVELEGYAMYATLLIALWSVVGGPAMRTLWFPLFYLAFIFPPPETIVAAVTLPLKMELSRAGIATLALFGYPISGQGVAIYIGQYQLLVAAACAGLNSIVSLSAISLFYIYMRHEAQWGYAALLTLFIVPVALVANYVRVLILVLLTYHAGEAAAQGFLHNLAGLLMFAVALLTIFGLDALLKPAWDLSRAHREKDK